MPSTAKFLHLGSTALPEPANFKGFTLIELMIAIAILSVLLSIAIPGFRQFLISTRLTSQANQLVGDLAYARNEAGTKNRNVIVCIAATPTSCATSGDDWALGWLIWSDLNGNSSLDAATEILKYTAPLDGNVSVILSGLSPNTLLTFRPHGGLPSTTGSLGNFKFCESGFGDGRRVSIPYTGRASVKRETNYCS